VRDTIVVGASAGGIEAVPGLIAQLPPGVAAAVLVVQHLAEYHEPMLVAILRRRTPLPVEWAEQGARIEIGRIYVAPPGLHMLIVDDHLQLLRGPRENHARPSIDRLFRSAAALRGDRTIGVLLTGMLDDGVAGLRAIRGAGGYAIAQAPEDAAFPDLPHNAIAARAVDRVIPLHAMGRALVALLGEGGEKGEASPALQLEASLDRSGPADPAVLARLGSQVPIACPECHGPLWEIKDGELAHYRCFVGHSLTGPELIRRGDERIESALWAAIRALLDRASTYEALAGEALVTAPPYAKRANEAREQAEVLRRFAMSITLG